MSAHAALQRMLVRMQHDPVFAERLLLEVKAGVPLELLRAGLGERERGWLLATDGRAFLHDPLKRRRLLHGLMGELKASSAIALALARRIALLDGFTASQHFHGAVQQGTSLAAAFAAFLLDARLGHATFDEVVRLEAELARCRRELEAAGGVDWRAPPVPPSLTHVARAPGVSVGRYSPDALDAIQAAERYLFEVGLVPALALCDDAPRLALPAPTGRPRAPLGLVPTLAGITIVELDEALYEAIAAVEGVVPVERIGAERARSLVEDEVLIAAVPVTV